MEASIVRFSILFIKLYTISESKAVIKICNMHSNTILKIMVTAHKPTKEMKWNRK